MNAVQPFFAAFVLAILVEGLIEYFATFVPARHKRYAAALVGVTVCLIYNVDLLAALGLPAVLPYAGAVLTGCIISRGSNYLNDWISRTRNPVPVSTTTTVINPVVQERAASVETEVRHDPA